MLIATSDLSKGSDAFAHRGNQERVRESMAIVLPKARGLPFRHPHGSIGDRRCIRRTGRSVFDRSKPNRSLQPPVRSILLISRQPSSAHKTPVGLGPFPTARGFRLFSLKSLLFYHIWQEESAVNLKGFKEIVSHGQGSAALCSPVIKRETSRPQMKCHSADFWRYLID